MDIEDDIDTSFIPMPLIYKSYKGEHGSETKKWSKIKRGYTHLTNGDIGIEKITPYLENCKADFLKT
jgi:type I restriction enzyme S subunit